MTFIRRGLLFILLFAAALRSGERLGNESTIHKSPSPRQVSTDKIYSAIRKIIKIKKITVQTKKFLFKQYSILFAQLFYIIKKCTIFSFSPILRLILEEISLNSGNSRRFVKGKLTKFVDVCNIVAHQV
jgi:hypothetical protein